MKSPKSFALCGYPISHSLSPRLFAAAYPQWKTHYQLLPTSDAGEAIRLFHEKKICGINVTSPLKTSILAYTHSQTTECLAIGACNLILKKGDLLVAHNTDTLGVSRSLSEAHLETQNARCLLIGAGGAAFAAAYALLSAGAKLLWANRTPAHIPASFCGHPTTPLPLSQIDHYLPQCHLIINTLSINIFDLHTNPFGPSQTIFDASYATRPLARQAAEAGATYIGGERWLIHQAIPSFIAMTGIEPDISSMESCLYQKYSLI